MRLAIIVDYAQGGTAAIAQPVAHEMRRRGHDVTYAALDSDGMPTATFDLVHFFNAKGMLQHSTTLHCPFIVTIHHMTLGYELYYVNAINECRPTKVHVIDHFCARQLGQRGIFNVIAVPQVLDYLPYLQRHDIRDAVPVDFTIGYLGGDAKFKRFWVVEEVAQRLGIKCIGHVSDEWWPQERVDQFYRSISCYVVASFEDGGPIPPQEALLYGRPVVSTHVGQMPYVLNPSLGVFYDGSVEGGMAAVGYVQRNYDRLRNGALAYMSDPLEAQQHTRMLTAYDDMYRKVLDAKG